MKWARKMRYEKAYKKRLVGFNRNPYDGAFIIPRRLSLVERGAHGVVSFPSSPVPLFFRTFREISWRLGTRQVASFEPIGHFHDGLIYFKYQSYQNPSVCCFLLQIGDIVI